MKRVYGALHDVEGAVETHLFGIAANDSGSTFLMRALATSRATRNLEREGQYETMCADPEAVEEKIRGLVPALDDLRLRQSLRVEDGRYHEMLTDMNARQIARLKPEQIAVFNRVFREHRDLFDHFGYELMEPGR